MPTNTADRARFSLQNDGSDGRNYQSSVPVVGIDNRKTTKRSEGASGDNEVLQPLVSLHALEGVGNLVQSEFCRYQGFNLDTFLAKK